MKYTLIFLRDYETKNMIRFNEQVAPGNEKVVGSLYLTKAVAKDSKIVQVTVETDVPQVTNS